MPHPFFFVALVAGAAAPAAIAGPWSRYPACNTRFDADRAICQKVKTRPCWASQAERLAWCNAHTGETGTPSLVTR